MKWVCSVVTSGAVNGSNRNHNPDRIQERFLPCSFSFSDNGSISSRWNRDAKSNLLTVS